MLPTARRLLPNKKLLPTRTMGQADGDLTEQRAAQLIALDDALTDLAALDERKSQIIELRFFGGLSLEETAEVMKISPSIVQREWRAAKAWLHHTMTTEKNPD